jgi:hypothetical protein
MAGKISQIFVGPLKFVARAGAVFFRNYFSPFAGKKKKKSVRVLGKLKNQRLICTGQELFFEGIVAGPGVTLVV